MLPHSAFLFAPVSLRPFCYPSIPFLIVSFFRAITTTSPHVLPHSSSSSSLTMAIDGFNVDLRGKTAFIAGVADANGYGWAITKHLAEAGCKVIVGTWPPVLGKSIYLFI